MSPTGPGPAGAYRPVGSGRPGPGSRPDFAFGFSGGPDIICLREPSFLHDQRQSGSHQSDANPDVGHVEYGRIGIDVDPIDDGPGVVAVRADCPVDQIAEAPARCTAHEERRQWVRCSQGEHDQHGERHTLQECDHGSVAGSEPERRSGVGDQPKLDNCNVRACRWSCTEMSHSPSGADQVGGQGERDPERHPAQVTPAAAAGPPGASTARSTRHGCCPVPRLERNSRDAPQAIVVGQPAADASMGLSVIPTEGAT